MTRILCYAFTIIVTATTFSACKKDSTPAIIYAPGQGKITGSGGANFSAENTSALFSKVADTITLQARVDAGTISGKSFAIGMVVKSTGTISFNNFAGNTTGNFTSGAIAYYTYETTNTGGSIIAHEYFVKSGSVNVTSFSGSQVKGTYTGTFADINNNGDPDITVNGSFDGNF
ncbi:MAG: hypothetical protein ABI091_31980 [Ferruginibacter sp.]